VFELYVQLRRRNQAKPSAQRIAKLFGLRKQNRTHCIRTMIDATSTAISRPEAAGAEPCGTPGANAENGRTFKHSCGKTVGLPVAPISLLQPTQGEGIRVASSTAAPELVGLI
jgi:hypothetical protein